MITLVDQVPHPCDIMFGVPHHLILYSGVPDQRHRHLKQKLEEIEKDLSGCVSLDEFTASCKNLLEGKQFGKMKTEFKFINIT